MDSSTGPLIADSDGPERLESAIPHELSPRDRWQMVIDLRQVALFGGVFLAIFFIHFLSPIIRAGGDTSWSIHTAVSILHEGNLDLNEYEDFVEGQRFRFAARVGDDVHNGWPVGPSIISLPIVALFDQGFDRILGMDLEQYLSVGFPGRIERFIASLYVAIAATLMFAVARQSLGLLGSLFIVFVFAQCTTVWSTASRALWTHTVAIVFLSLTLLILVRSERNPRVLRWLGLVLGLAFMARVTSVIPAVLLSLFVLLHHRRQLIPFAAGAVAVVALHFGIIYLGYGQLETPYQRLANQVIARQSLWDYFPEALAGTLISPARGLFVFSPILILSLLGIGLAFRRRPFRRFDMYLVAALVLHWIAISSFPIWWAGWSYGPRTFTDAVPTLVYFLIPVVAILPSLRRPMRTVLIGLLGALSLISFSIHLRGVTSWQPFWWDGIPDSIDRTTERLWDWRNPPMLWTDTPANDIWRCEQRYRFSAMPWEPRDVSHWLLQAQEHMQRGEWEEARRVAEVARHIDPTSGAVNAVLAVATLRLGDHRAGIEPWIWVCARYEDDDIEQFFALAHEELGAESISMADALWQGHASPWRCREVAQWLSRQGLQDEALEVWRLATAIGPPHVEFLFGEYRTLAAQGRWEECLAVALRAVDLDPDHGYAHLYLGNALERLGRMEEARAAWTRATEVPTDGGSHATAQENLDRTDPGQVP